MDRNEAAANIEEMTVETCSCCGYQTKYVENQPDGTFVCFSCAES